MPMPVAAARQQAVQTLMGFGYDDTDFMALLELEARASGLGSSRRTVPGERWATRPAASRSRCAARLLLARERHEQTGARAPAADPMSPSHALSSAIGIMRRSSQGARIQRSKASRAGRGAR